MKKIVVIALVAMLVATMFGGNVIAGGGGDEHYNGEDGEQPAPGISEGPGEPSVAPDTGDRTRNKDR
jgi:hypothetical protein